MNFLRYFWDSIRGFQSYRTFMTVGVGSAIGYWALFCVLLSGLMILRLDYYLHHDFPKIAGEIAPKIPAFRIEKGNAICALPQPVLTHTNQFPVILDMEGNVNHYTETFPLGVLIRKQDLTVWRKGGTPFQSSLQAFPDGEVDARYLIKLSREFRYGLPFLILGIFPVLLMVGFVQAIIFTLLAALLENSIQPRFSLRQLFNFSVFALTPGALIATIYSLLGLVEMNPGMLYFSCYGFFLIFSTGACRIFLLKNPPPLN